MTNMLKSENTIMKKAVKKLITDQKMLFLRDMLKDMGVIKFYYEFDDVIGMKRQYIHFIESPEKHKKGNAHFSAENILKAVEHYKVNPSWIFGVSEQIFQ